MSQYVYHSLTVMPACRLTFHRFTFDVVVEVPFDLMKGEQIRIRVSNAEAGRLAVQITRPPTPTPTRHVPSLPRELFRESESPPDTPSPEPVGPEPTEGNFSYMHVICQAHVLQQCRVLRLNLYI